MGSGASGIVYKAQNLDSKQIVGLKILYERNLDDDTSRKRFLRECKALSSIHSDYIISLYESGEATDSTLYYAMEYIDGELLDEYVNKKKLDLKSRLEIFIKICHGVHSAHQLDIIHRDLKPENIYIDSVGNPRIIDFGLVKFFANDNLAEITLNSDFVGTPAFMAPEQTYGGSKDVDKRTDIYALGVLLYNLMTNTYPFSVSGTLFTIFHNIKKAEPVKPNERLNQIRQKNKKSILESIPEELELIILKAISKEKDNRYQTVEELIGDLEKLITDLKVIPDPESSFKKLLNLFKN